MIQTNTVNLLLENLADHLCGKRRCTQGAPSLASVMSSCGARRRASRGPVTARNPRLNGRRCGCLLRSRGEMMVRSAEHLLALDRSFARYSSIRRPPTSHELAEVGLAVLLWTVAQQQTQQWPQPRCSREAILEALLPKRHARNGSLRIVAYSVCAKPTMLSPGIGGGRSFAQR